MEFARRHGLHVIEDACQAHGARWNGRARRQLRRCRSFSFYPGKNLGAYGDAGAIVTSDPEMQIDCACYAISDSARSTSISLRRRTAGSISIQAAVLDVKLRHLDAWNDARRGHAAAYDARLAEIGITPPSRLTKSRTSTISTSSRSSIGNELRQSCANAELPPASTIRFRFICSRLTPTWASAAVRFHERSAARNAYSRSRCSPSSRKSRSNSLPMRLQTRRH